MLSKLEFRFWVLISIRKRKPAIFTIRKAENKLPRMDLGLYNNNLVAISQLEKLASLLQCDACGRINYRTHKFRQHRSVCTGTKPAYCKTGYFTPKMSVITMVEKLGIKVDPADFFDPSVIGFDFEVGFEKIEKSFYRNAEKLLFTHRHFPISVAVASNVPGFRDACVFTNSDPKKLIEKFIIYCIEISEEAQRFFIL